METQVDPYAVTNAFAAQRQASLNRMLADQQQTQQGIENERQNRLLALHEGQYALQQQEQQRRAQELTKANELATRDRVSSLLTNEYAPLARRALESGQPKEFMTALLAQPWAREKFKADGIFDPDKVDVNAQDFVSGLNAIAAFGGAPEGQKIGAFNPGDYTPKSFATFQKTRNAADLVRYVSPAQQGVGGASGFGDTRIQDLQAAIAAVGYSLPTGFRSKEQQLSLLRGLTRKYEGLDVNDIAHLLANNAIDYKGVTKATQAASSIGGKVEFANQELAAFAPIALDANSAVKRSNFVPFNKLQQMGERNISDPDLKRLYVATQSILNAYNMLSARGGTDAEVRAHNRQVLMTADSPEAYEAAVQMIIREGHAAGEAARKSMSATTYGRPDVRDPTARAIEVGPARIQSDADYAALPSGAEFIAPDGSRRRKP